MKFRYFAAMLALIPLVHVHALAQQEGEEQTGSDTVMVDSTSMYDDDFDADSNYYDGDQYEYDSSGGGGGSSTGFGFGGGTFGVYGGPTFEIAALDPHELDPDLDGTMLVYGGQGFAILSGWVIGGGGYGAEIYDIASNYDEFSFHYGGFIGGYDKALGRFSIRGTLMIGSGGIKMIKKRPSVNDSVDVALQDYEQRNGVEILERYRQEDFFTLRPTISIGFAPVPFFDFRLSASYVMPIGGANASDLYTLTYGLQLMFGIGR